MKDDKIWFIKIEIPKTNTKITVCNNGVVYVAKKNVKSFTLKEEAFYQLKRIIKDNIYSLRTMRYFKHSKEGTIIKINDTSRKHPNPIKIVGWSYEIEILKIIINESNVENLYNF